MSEKSWILHQSNHERCEEQYSKLEQKVENLTKDLEFKQSYVQDLQKQLTEMESLKEAVKQLQA